MEQARQKDRSAPHTYERVDGQDGLTSAHAAEASEKFFRAGSKLPCPYQGLEARLGDVEIHASERCCYALLTAAARQICYPSVLPRQTEDLFCNHDSQLAGRTLCCISENRALRDLGVLAG